MKRTCAIILCILLLLSLLTGCGDQSASQTAAGPESPYVTAVSEKQNFSTKHLKSYSSVWDDEDGLYIYTEEYDSIPYVLIWRYEDISVEPKQFLEESIYNQMVEKYGSDLIGVGPVEDYSIGDKTLPGILFSYLIDGYTIESLRLVYQCGDDIIGFNAKYVKDNGDGTIAALDNAVRYFTDGVAVSNDLSDNSDTHGSGDISDSPKTKEVIITPSESAAVEYVKYVDASGYSSLDIPKDWIVTVGMPPDKICDLISYAITVSDPDNTDRRMYINLSCAAGLKSREASDWYNTWYPDTFGVLPIISDVSTAGFFSAFGEYYGYSDFKVTENIGRTALNGDLLNATAVSSVSGKPIQGLFTAMVTDMTNYVQKDMFNYSGGTVDVGFVSAYTIIYETAPEEEFLDWQPVLGHCLESLYFTDSFLSQRQEQWKSVMATSSYIFNTANEISDMIMDTWETRNTSYDVISQKQSDATLGYDRVLDKDTGLYYKADAGFGDVFDDDRYVVVDDDNAYLTPTSGWIEWKK